MVSFYLPLTHYRFINNDKEEGRQQTRCGSLSGSRYGYNNVHITSMVMNESIWKMKKESNQPLKKFTNFDKGTKPTTLKIKMNSIPNAVMLLFKLD